MTSTTTKNTIGKSVRLAVICVLVFGSSHIVWAQGSILEHCDTPLVVFGEYDEDHNRISLRCINDGQVITLLPYAGTGELSPSRDFVAYINHDHEADTMSLYLYDMRSNANTILSQGDGHIAANWVPTDKLVVYTWREPITHISEIDRPYYRALYDPVTGNFTQLFWPVGVTEFYYLPDEGRLVLRSSSYGVFSIGLNGLLQPIELPYAPNGTAPLGLDISEDGSTAIYALKCPNSDHFSCFAVYDMRTGDVELCDVFQQEGYQAINRLSLSSTARFVAFDLDQHQLGVYDLNERKIVHLETEQSVDGYRWVESMDVLLIAISAEIPEKPGRWYSLYRLDAKTGDIELALDDPVQWTEFY